MGLNGASDCIQQCLPTAEEYGVLLALENHWGCAQLLKGNCAFIKKLIHPGWEY
jgi:sugar phosphate isomerase/epimerase